MKDITPIEERFLRALLVRMRQDAAQGQQWVQIVPQFNVGPKQLACSMPMSVPSEMFEDDEEIDYGATKVDLDETDTAVPVLLDDLPLLPAPPEAPPTQDAILKALQEATVPLPMQSLANRAKCKNNSHFRAEVRHLSTMGQIKKLEGNTYWLSMRPLDNN